MKTEGFTPAQGLPQSEPTPAARARLPRPVREQQMLDAATEIFGTHGYHSASMDQIAEEVGISKPMLYAYFDSKEGLCAACLKRAGIEAVESVSASYRPEYSPEDALWAGFTAFFEFVREHPSSWRIVRSAASYDQDHFRELVTSVHQDFRRVIEELSRLASKQTKADPLADDEMRAGAAWAMFGAASAMADRWLDGESEASPEFFATQLMNFLWLGFNDLAEGEIWEPSGATRASD